MTPSANRPPGSGRDPREVATLNTLTVNLHLLFATFFRPAGRRTAILIDAPTFPSDRYAVESQLRLHGLDPERELIVVRPRDGEALLRTEDIESAIRENRVRLAVALLAGVNYATGQVHDIERLTAAVHEAGGVALWDLAHAAGEHPARHPRCGRRRRRVVHVQVPQQRAGAIAQLFIHERHATDASRLRLTGWWGNDPATRFRMADFEPGAGADGWRISTPPILSLAPVRASLAIFDEVGMRPCERSRSR